MIFNKKIFLRLYFFLLLFSLLPWRLIADPIRVETLGCAVTAISKDNSGMMWIGSECGLRMFDGYDFYDVPGALSRQHINCVRSDSSRKVVWVGTPNGLYTVNYLSRIVTKAFPKNEAVLAFTVERQTRTLYVLYKDGTLLTIDRSGTSKTISVPALSYSLPVSPYQTLVHAGNDNLVILLPRKEKLYRYDLAHQQLHVLNEYVPGTPIYINRYETGKCRVMPGRAISS